jgi:hypothetical protein
MTEVQKAKANRQNTWLRRKINGLIREIEELRGKDGEDNRIIELSGELAKLREEWMEEFRVR